MKKNNYPGKLIIAEGLDGSGKSTNLNLLKNWLEISGYATQVYKRKTSPLIASSINEAKEDKSLIPITYSLIHAADFSDILCHSVVPALKAGFIVLFNKYTYTSIAKDYLRGLSKEWILKLYDFALEPDAVLYFRIPLEHALQRMSMEEKEKDFYDSGMDIGFGSNSYTSLKAYQSKLQDQYELMARQYNFSIIDASLPITQQQAQIQRYLQSLLG